MTRLAIAGLPAVPLGERRWSRVLEPSLRLVAVISAALLVATTLTIVDIDHLTIRRDTASAQTASNDSAVGAGALSAASQVPLADLILQEQLARVGDGIRLTGVGTAEASSSLTPDFDARFMLAGPTFQADTGASFAVTTAAFGGEPVSVVEPVLSGDQVLYERGDFTEWWIQRGDDFEQGWTVAAPPADGSDLLAVTVRFPGAAPTQVSSTSVELTLGDGSKAQYRDLHAFDADGSVLPASLMVVGSDVLITVDAEGATYPVTIDPIIDADEKILPPRHASGDQFGTAIATDGTRLAASSPFADEGTFNDAGRVDVYTSIGVGWAHDSGSVAYPGPAPANFGWDLDIWGDRMVVSAPLDDANGTDAGAVFVYDWNGSTWTLFQTIYECTATEAAACDGSATSGFDGNLFGYSVALSDTDYRYIAIGAPGDAVDDTGSAYIFAPTGPGGAYQLTLDGVLDFGSGLAAGDRFGEAIDITHNGEFVVVGSPGAEAGGFTDSGRIHLYQANFAGQFFEVGSDLGPGGGNELQYGAAVAAGIDSNGGDIVVAGRPYASRRFGLAATPFAGGARVLYASNSGLSAVGLGDITSAVIGDGHGFSVAFDGDKVVLGAPFNAGTGPERGLAHVYQYLPGPVDTPNRRMDNGGSGASAATLGIPSNFGFPLPATGDHYGYSVAYAGAAGKALVGAINRDETSSSDGRLGVSTGVVASYTPGTFSTPGTIISTVKVAERRATNYDEFGSAVALDGNNMAVGVKLDDEAGTGRGAVLVYTRASATDPWTLADSMTYEDGDSGSTYGRSLDLEGDYLAIGSPDGDGQVDVFQRQAGNDWVLRESFIGNEATDNVSFNLDFGWDVAISDDGDWVAVGIPGYDQICGSVDCGALQVYRWNADEGLYEVFDTVANNYGEEDQVRYGTSVDLDTVPGTSEIRFIAGRFNDGVAIDSWLVDPATDFELQFENNIASNNGIGQSVALDGNRIAAASSIGATDQVVVADTTGPDNEWSVRELSSVALSGTSLQANNLVDVDGDFIVAGRGDGVGGEVMFFYNDPAYGWGFPNFIGGFGGPRWDQGPQQQIQPSGRQAGDAFGRAVAVDSISATEAAIVGGAAGDDDRGTDAGAVYSTTVQGSGGGSAGVPANKLTSNDFGSNQFGFSVSVDGNQAVIGQPGTGTTGGVVHLLEQAGGTWTIVDSLTNGSVGDGLGYGVAIDGIRFVAIGRDGTLALYGLDEGGSYSQLDSISVSFGSGPVPLDSVDLLGDWIVVGSVGNGVTYFEIVGDSLVQQHFASRVAGDAQGGDSFGADVALAQGTDGLYALVGAPLWDEGAAVNRGKAYVFADIEAAGLGVNDPAQEILAPANYPGGGRFGASVAADADRFVIGHVGAVAARFGNPANPAATGMAYVYDRTGPLAWSLTQALESVDFTDHNDTADQYGSDVALDGGIIVIGASDAEERDVPWRQGAAYTWITEDDTTWTETDLFRAADDGSGDRFGAVGISGDQVLVGAYLDDNPLGLNAGAAYSYTATEPVPVVVDNPTLNFGLTLDAASPTSVTVGSSGIDVSAFDADLIEEAADDGSSIAAAAFTQTDIQDSPLSGLPLSGLPLSGLLVDDESFVANIPLIDVDIDGGWEALLSDAGSDLADVPLLDLTLGDVYNDAQAGPSLASTPLSGLELDGTPLSGLPLSGLVLGGLPLSGLSTDFDWCEVLDPFVTGCDPNSTTLIEAQISGAPLSGLPLSGLPLSGLDISGTPLSGLPLSGLELDGTPLSGLPLSGLPLSGLDIDGTPLSGLPLSGLPLSGLPLSGLPLSGLEINGAPLSGLPLSDIGTESLPLSGLVLENVPLSGLPLSGLSTESLPLSGLPLSGLVLADAPLSGLDLGPQGTDWCTVLEELQAGYDCSYAQDETTFLNNTTIADLGINGVPLSGLPLSGLPLSGLDVNGTPLSGLPLSGLPLSGLPLSGLPLSGLPLSGLPLSGLYPAGSPLSGLNLDQLPLSGLDVDGSPLSGLPLSGLPLSGLPLSGLDLGSTPLSGLPLSGLPLSGLPLSGLDVNGSPLSGLPLSGLDIGDTPLSGLPLSGLPLSGLNVDCELVDCEIDSLGDAVRNGAIDVTAVTLADLQPYLGGITLGEIANSFLDGTTVADLLDAVANATGASGPLTLDDLTDLDGVTLGDLPQSVLDQIQLGDLDAVLHAITWDDLLGNMIDPETGDPLNFFTVLGAFQGYIDGGNFTLADLEYFGESTFGDLIQVDDLSGFTFADLGSILGLIHINSLIDETDWSATDDTLGELLADDALGDLTLGDLVGEYRDFTLGELIGAANAGVFAGYTVGDLLLLLVGIDPAAFSGLEFTQVEAGQLPEDVVAPVTFEANFQIDDTNFDKTLDLVVSLPSTATYVRNSAVVDQPLAIASASLATPSQVEPEIGENTLTWRLAGISPGVPYELTFDVKPSVSLGSTSLNSQATIAGTDISAFAFSSVEVVEGLEPNNFPATTSVDLNTDKIYLTYISSEDDHDVFSVTVGENDELAIQLSSLTEDLDLVLYGDPLDNAAGSPLSGTSDEAPIEPIKDPDQSGADSEPLDDFRRLDEEDPNLQFIDISNSPGTETELLVTDALAAGTYYIHVFGANGVTNSEPAALQIQLINGDPRPACAAEGTVTGTIGTARTPVGTPNTLFLVNQQRLEHFYGATEANSVMTALDDFADYLVNDATGSTLGINPLVMPVDQFGTVQTAYAAWDADGTCSPGTVNDVVKAINAEIETYRADLDNIVVIGSDHVVPMARLSDQTEIANEYDFRYEFIGDNLVGGNADEINSLSASFWDRLYLSDEPYGETAARDLGDRFLYVADVSLGRMVETPAEIVAGLQHFQQFDGRLQANTATVLGYDFLIDSSTQIAADLVAAGLTVDDEFADGADAVGNLWDKDDAAAVLIPEDDGDPATNGPVDDLISLNGHFDHYRALPANGDKVPGFTDLFLADTIEQAPTVGGLVSKIIFSMGCHGGLSVPDSLIGDGPDNTNGDWAQTFAADQAIYLGNTGFGYGDTEKVAYTEQLIALFTEYAVRPTDLGAGQQTTIGQALTFAKNEYASDLSVFSVYDEKALQEMTFYGLPFYTVDRTVEDAPPVPDNTTAPDSTNLQTLGVNVDAANTPEVGPRGTTYSNPDENGDPQEIVAPGYPIQPSQSTDVSVVDPNDPTELNEVAHGAVVLSMQSQYIAPIDPVVASVVFQEGDDADQEPPLGDVVFPAKPVTVNRATGPGGERQTLVVATGQFNSEGQTQRLDDDINTVVYYATPGDTDFTAPKIGRVESVLNLDGDQLTVTLDATDEEGDVVRIYVLFAPDPGSGTVTWLGIDLVNTPGTDDWSGSSSVPAGTSVVEFLVQVVDSSGNVGYATNKARNFSDDGSVAPIAPSPDLEVTVDDSNYNDEVDWYTGPVAVSVDSGDLSATYEISPGTPITDVTDGGFTIDGQGTFVWTVTRLDGQVETGLVRIDSLAPEVSLAPPGDGSTYQVSQVPSIGFSCQDPGLDTCTANVDGNPIGNGDPLPAGLGDHDVVVTGTDALGQSASASATYTVVADPLEDLVVTVSDANLEDPPGLYTDDVVVTVDGGGEATEYSLDGGETTTPIPAAGGTFTITAEGVTNWTVTRPADGAVESGSVEIDRLAPVVEIATPVDGASFEVSDVPAVAFSCVDANLDTCTGAVDGDPIVDGEQLPAVVGGPYTVEVTGTDTLGRSTVESVTYTVVADPLDDLVVTVSDANLEDPPGLYTDDVVVTVDGGGEATEYSLDGGVTTTPIPAAGGTFTITAEGMTNWAVTRPADGAVESGSVEIDRLAPVVEIATPVDGASFEVSDVPAVAFSCVDANLDTCLGAVDGDPIVDGEQLPAVVGGPYTVEVTGTDTLGRSTVESVTYTVVADPPGDLVVTVSDANLEDPPGLYTDDVVVTVDGGGEATEYSLDGGETTTPIPAAGGSFTITAEGVTNWRVSRPSDGASDSGTVEVDRLSPEVTIAAPVDGSQYPAGSVPTVSFTCDDANLATCEATVDGEPIADGDPLPDEIGGPYVVEVTGTDTLGRQTVVTAQYTVVPNLGAVAIDEIWVDGVAEPGEPVDVEGEFSGGAAPYTLSVDWGDGADCSAGTCSVSAPTGGDPGVFDADYIYPVGGVYTVVVTITDANGLTATASVTTATCTIIGTSRNDVLQGTAGDDVICALAGNDRVFAGSGNDLVFGGSGRDTLFGQNGDDQLFGGRDNDRLYGQNDADDLRGGAGADLVFGGLGDDTIRGGRDNDRLYGQNGNDIVIGNRGADRIYGGNDDDKLFGRRGNDRLYGQNGDDEINGGDGRDLVFGGGGNDTIFGLGGRDNLNGGGGNDIIDGGTEADRCRGNAGVDVLANCES